MTLVNPQPQERKTGVFHELVSLDTPYRRPESQTRWKHFIFLAPVVEKQMTAILGNTDSDVSKSVDPFNNSLTIFFSQIRYVKVHTATRWTIRHGLMLLWFEN